VSKIFLLLCLTGIWIGVACERDKGENLSDSGGSLSKVNTASEAIDEKKPVADLEGEVENNLGASDASDDNGIASKDAMVPTGSSGQDASSDQGKPVLAVCNDGIVQPGEECDDGDQDEGNGCTTQCKHSCATGKGDYPKCANECAPASTCNDATHRCIPGDPRAEYASCRNGEGYCENGGCVLSVCGDGVQQPSEECDLSKNGVVLTSDGSRGLLAGTEYNEWNCNPNTCKRRYIYTPCFEVGWEVANCPNGFCEAQKCEPLDSACQAWGLNNLVVHCKIEGKWDGICAMDRCYPSCRSASECPPGAICDIMYQGYSDKVCQ
jgi:cysteine-rich repeat protein